MSPRVMGAALLLAACSAAAPNGEPPSLLPPLPPRLAVAPAPAWVPAPPVPIAVRATAPAPLLPRPAVARAVAVDFLAEVFEEPRMSSRIVGWIQTGRGVDVGEPHRPDNGQCSQGFRPLADGRGWVCAGRGVRIGLPERPTRRGTGLARLDDLVPYRYAFVHAAAGTPRYGQRPTPEERDARESAGPAAPGAGRWDRWMGRGFMMSVRGLAGLAPNSFWSCVRGGYVRYDHAYTIRPRPFVGVELVPAAARLPLGFVTAFQPRRWRAEGGGLVEDGRARRLEPIDASRPTVLGGVAVLVGLDGLLHRAEDVSIVKMPPLPPDLGPTERWIHVSLADQTLVALEGARPVYATVVSTGLPMAGHRTRPGTFRIQAKHVTATMDSDTSGDTYSIEDVPWTMFYDQSYALHAAFWHERFGHPQSHGCVNLSAADAKWLFRWSSPQLPPGWYGRAATAAEPGTRIVIQ